MTTCITLGANSDIYKSIKPLMMAEGWACSDVTRFGPALNTLPEWDVCLICIGTVAPVGMWWDIDADLWEEGISSNLLTPLRLLRRIWKRHKPGATVVWMAGSNPNMIMPGYSSYNTSKMAVLKLVEQMDYETPDAKFVALGPGTVLTKIHEGTRKAKWPNPKLAVAKRTTEEAAPGIWQSMKWCIEQPKEVVGGRNICVSDPVGDMLANEIRRNPEMYKLRRKERVL